MSTNPRLQILSLIRSHSLDWPTSEAYASAYFNTFQTSYWPETYFALSTESNSQQLYLCVLHSPQSLTCENIRRLHSHVSRFFHGTAKKHDTSLTQSIFSSNFYWYICVKICILEQIIATVLFICLSSIKTERSILEFQSTTAPLTEGGLPVHLPTRSHSTDHTYDRVKNIYYTGI